MNRLIARLLWGILFVPAVEAQNIRGTVRDDASGSPVPGTIVIVLDSARLMLTRTVTNARGEYELVRAPNARILRTMRLGFRPQEIPIPASANVTLQMDVRIVAVPVTLDAVRTVAAAQCPRRRDAQAALNLLEQARTGLLATVVARESNPAILTRLAVIRRRDFLTDSILAMSVEMDSAQTTNSYASALTASAFIETGFATDDSGIITTYGPDAEVLLDEAFSNGYCFKLMDARESRPRQIGLGFEPAVTRRGRVNIDGALWIDTATKALVDIEFLYRGFDRRFDRGRPGGRIEFRAMPNGVTIIDRWHLRVPSMASGTRSQVFPSARRSSVVIQETGGELARARWEDGTTWKASLGSVRMRLMDMDGQADNGRVVRLDSTSYVATADSSGSVVIHELVPGPYSVALLDGRLQQIGLSVPTGVTFSAVRDSTMTLTITTMTPHQMVQESCLSRGMQVGSVAVIGRVLNDDGSPADGVDLAIDRSAEGKPLERVAEGMKTAGDGLFRWCGLGRGASIAINAQRGRDKRTVSVSDLPPGLTVVQFRIVP